MLLYASTGLRLCFAGHGLVPGRCPGQDADEDAAGFVLVDMECVRLCKCGGMKRRGSSCRRASAVMNSGLKTSGQKKITIGHHAGLNPVGIGLSTPGGQTCHKHTHHQPHHTQYTPHILSSRPHRGEKRLHSSLGRQGQPRHGIHSHPQPLQATGRRPTTHPPRNPSHKTGYQTNTPPPNMF